MLYSIRLPFCTKTALKLPRYCPYLACYPARMCIARIWSVPAVECSGSSMRCTLQNRAANSPTGCKNKNREDGGQVDRKKVYILYIRDNTGFFCPLKNWKILKLGAILAWLWVEKVSPKNGTKNGTKNGLLYPERVFSVHLKRAFSPLLCLYFCSPWRDGLPSLAARLCNPWRTAFLPCFAAVGL